MHEYIIEHYTNNMSQLIKQWITNKKNIYDMCAYEAWE